MRKRLMSLLMAGAALAAMPGVASAHGGRSEMPSTSQRELAQVRRATAKFHNLRAAEAAGYINPGAEHCVEVPGLGGMGVHFVNPELVMDGVLDPTKPEVLLFAPSGNGLKLVGVEYLLPTATMKDPTVAPTLFGRVFDGPMPEHERNTTGDHYDMHAWIWSHNPNGVLATWNPSIHC